MLKAKKVVYQFLVLAALMLTIEAVAQRDEMAPVTDTYAIKNVTIVQAPGRVIPMGTVLISNGLIKQVGASVTIPSNAKVIDADSMFVYAGFIDGLSYAGIPRPEERQRPRDVLSMAPPYEWAGIQPHLPATQFLDPSDKSLVQMREAGFTITQVVPRGQMLPGQGTILVLSGEDKSEMVLREGSTLFSQLSGARGVFPATTIGVMAKWRDLYRNASYARIHSANYASNPAGMERPDYDPVIESLFPVTTNQLSVTFDAKSDLDIHRVIALQKDLGFKLVLANIEKGWPAMSKIKSSGAGVLLSYDLPKEAKIDSSREMETDRDKEIAALEKKNVEAYMQYTSQAAKFSSGGVKFGFSSMSAKPADLKKNLMIMIENGLSEDAALSALTTNPASILGISNIAGTVDAGKMANLVVTTKPYFSEESAIKYVFADGDMYEFDIKAKSESSTEGAEVIVGTWNYTASSGDGDSEGVITITNDGGGLSGSMTNSQVPVPGDISDVSISGKEVSFVVTFNMDGQNFEVEASVTVEKNTMEGELITPFGNAALTGEKDPNN